ncbi:MAG: gliding motility-associated C-terminal domain-containing protein [Flavobacteriales bacterium]|jgi:gliding motility-associated-like protein|nr:gliding motility-associated C-terminal domain-containing protein [Flavobacteriales bacterium]
MRYLVLVLALFVRLLGHAQDECPVQLNATAPTCPGDADGSLTVVGVGGPYTYAWAHDPTITVATAGGLAVGDYVVFVNGDDGCESVLFGVVDEPIVTPLGTMTTTDISCPGAADGTVSFTVSPGPYTWEWLDAPLLTATTRIDLGPANFTVLVSGGTCPSFISASLGDPYIDIGGAAVYCPSSPPVLTAFPQWGFQPDLYLWSTGEITTTITIVPGTEGVIDVIGVDTVLGCSAMGDITLTELPYPTVAFAAPDTVCIRVNAIAITTATTADSLVWRWGANGYSNEENPTVNFTRPFWQPISLQGFDLFGCGGPPVRDSVYVRPRLPANFTLEQVPCTPMVDIVFSSPSDSCAFFVGDSLIMDLCSGYVRRDMRRYQEYDFTFYSTQPNRCDDTSAVHIDVRTEPTLFLPNAFTPDGDGINDTWPGPVDIPEDGFEVQLFDRWGVSQWASIDTQAKWDGSLLPVGVYVYTMRHRDPCEPTQEVARNGTVTLIR